MIAVTGMHRSGTSCVTGLLKKCGYSTGTAEELVNGNVPQPDNEKGHFENYDAVKLNEDLLDHVKGTWYNPPPVDSLEKADPVFSERFEIFRKNFTGSVFKDPRICLTIPLWEKYCPELEFIVLCLRNPMGVANSLLVRNMLTIDTGLILWCEYNLRLIQGVKNLKIAVIDYDNLSADPHGEFWNLLQRLGSGITKEEMQSRIEGFFEKKLNHYHVSEEDNKKMPKEIIKLYNLIKSKDFKNALK